MKIQFIKTIEKDNSKYSLMRDLINQIHDLYDELGYPNTEEEIAIIKKKISISEALLLSLASNK